MKGNTNDLSPGKSERNLYIHLLSFYCPSKNPDVCSAVQGFLFGAFVIIHYL